MNGHARRGLNHAYSILGDCGQGACLAVQSVLQEYGLCGYTEWSSPEWHFFYLTHLEKNEIVDLLGDLCQRFTVQIGEGQSEPLHQP